ncbi:MAG: twitching motility protein PilT [Candidatus Hydrogenedentes bacterium]|nr:twitching motility protein PilT [Candidatus Hydrogenedentota bacterium]
MLLDSNIIIYSIQPEFQSLRNWVNENRISVSAINLVEVLGYHRLTTTDKRDFEELFSCTIVYPVSQDIIDTSVALRTNGGKCHWVMPSLRPRHCNTIKLLQPEMLTILTGLKD